MKVPVALVVGLALATSAVAVLAGQSYRATVLADKPFAYYPLDEASNKDAVIDEAGHNPGVFVNQPEVEIKGAILAEPENRAVRFARAQNQYIKLTNLGNYGRSIASGFTFECWLKTANSKDHQNVFGAANSPDFVTDLLVDIAYEDLARRLRIYCRDDHNNRFEADFYPKDGNINLYDNRWHHIVYVCEPQAKEIKDMVRLYIDGEVQTISALRKGGAPTLSAFNEPVTLGAMNLRGVISESLDGALDDVAFYSTRLSPDQIARHYRAAGYKERPRSAQRSFGFPLIPPVENADPSARHEVTVQVPAKFTVERKPDLMIVTADLTDPKPEKMTVGENMVTGMEYRFVAYPKGDPAPAKADGFAMTNRVDFVGANHLFNQRFGGIPEEGKAYTVEMRWKIFETDIPPQHHWAPQGKKYKVLLDGTITQTVE